MSLLTRSQVASLLDLDIKGDPKVQVSCPECGRKVKRRKLTYHASKACPQRNRAKLKRLGVA